MYTCTHFVFSKTPPHEILKDQKYKHESDPNHRIVLILCVQVACNYDQLNRSYPKGVKKNFLSIEAKHIVGHKIDDSSKREGFCRSLTQSQSLPIEKGHAGNSNSRGNMVTCKCGEVEGD